MPNESMDMAILNFVTMYPSEDTDIVASELYRVVKPNGRVIISCLTSSFIPTELCKAGFKKTKWSWRPYLPYGAFVHVLEKCDPNSQTPLLEWRHQSPVLKPFISIMRVSDVPAALIFTNVACMVISIVVVFGAFYFSYYYWTAINIPKSISLSSGTQLPAGMLCPSIIWTFWSILEAVWVTHTYCRYGLLTTPKDVVNAFLRTSMTFAIVNIGFQAFFWVPQLLADLYLSKWFPESVSNTASFVLLMIVMVIGTMIYTKVQIQRARHNRANVNSEKISINIY
eukprot:TRINITY_DN8799_c0_g2_i1.p1 TRINITY_DN8799_c0_g2~~TRINITY_DN8799_c0_g2_i1.p1  ORF type:complete len:283 (-),score=17.84 TRINITY_DN8799_c0_g2_i1:53-901(-)